LGDAKNEELNVVSDKTPEVQTTHDDYSLGAPAQVTITTGTKTFAVNISTGSAPKDEPSLLTAVKCQQPIVDPVSAPSYWERCTDMDAKFQIGDYKVVQSRR